MKFLKSFIPMKGATAYEWQWRNLHLRIVHLSGDYWRWRPWRRVEVIWHEDWRV